MRGAHLRRGLHTLTVHGESVLITLEGKRKRSASLSQDGIKDCFIGVSHYSPEDSDCV